MYERERQRKAVRISPHRSAVAWTERRPLSRKDMPPSCEFETLLQAQAVPKERND